MIDRFIIIIIIILKEHCLSVVQLEKLLEHVRKVTIDNDNVTRGNLYIKSF